MQKDRMNLDSALEGALGPVEHYLSLLFDREPEIAMNAQVMLARSRDLLEAAFNAIREGIGDITVGFESRNVLFPASIQIGTISDARIEQASEEAA